DQVEKRLAYVAFVIAGMILEPGAIVVARQGAQEREGILGEVSFRHKACLRCVRLVARANRSDVYRSDRGRQVAAPLFELVEQRQLRAAGPGIGSPLGNFREVAVECQRAERRLPSQAL